jgi:hypothetical protein
MAKSKLVEPGTILGMKGTAVMCQRVHIWSIPGRKSAFARHDDRVVEGAKQSWRDQPVQVGLRTGGREITSPHFDRRHSRILAGPDGMHPPLADTRLGDVTLRNPITGCAGCCARAASGHAVAPPRRLMNLRRRMSVDGGEPASNVAAR